MAKSNGRTDEELVEASNRGDPRAFETLYHRHKEWATRLAYRFTGNEDDAMDVVQDAFLYFLKKFPGFRLTAQLTTFLYPVVKNISLSRIRRDSRCEPDEEIVTSAADAPAQESLGHYELAAAVSCLSELHREVLLMRFVDDMKVQDIARALGVPLGTVKSRLHNALKTLREDERTRALFGEES